MAESRLSLAERAHHVEPDGSAVRVVGVRMLGADLLAYFDPRDLDLEAGDWVVVETGGGREAGRVVIAPRQVRMTMLEGALQPIERRLDERDVDILDGTKKKLAATRAQGLPLALGHENEHYQKVKAGLPRLGQRVETPRGPGMVIALQMLKYLVTVRLDDDNGSHVFSSADLGFRRHDAVNPGEG